MSHVALLIAFARQDGLSTNHISDDGQHGVQRHPRSTANIVYAARNALDPCRRRGTDRVLDEREVPGLLTIAEDRLSRRHLQLAVVTARVTDAKGAVDVGFLDETVAAAAVLHTAVARAITLAGLHAKAYAGTVRAVRGDVLRRMADQIEADRAAGRAPTV